MLKSLGSAWRVAASMVFLTAAGYAVEPGLVGHWSLRGDCRDSSGSGNDGINHGVNLATGEFDGRGAYIEVPHSPSLELGGEFSVSAWIRTEDHLTDIPGDLVTKFEPFHRQGFSLSLVGNTSGYNGPGNMRQLFFGVDHATRGEWTDCGRPTPHSHSSDAATVFNGDLYVGTIDAADERNWAHVYRYRGGQEWEDVGRLGTRRTRGVYAMVVHDGALYASTTSSHNRQSPDMEFGRVYRYRGGQDWEEIGQPGDVHHLSGLASFNGKLYSTAYTEDAPGHIYEYAGAAQWRDCGSFDGMPHSLGLHDGRLYTAFPKGEVFAYAGAGTDWEHLGNPFGEYAICKQIHALGVYRGELYAGCWPTGQIAVRRDGQWIDLGRLGDATEVVGIAVYNGSLYGGTIPRAEICRFDGPEQWMSIRRLFDPPGFEPTPVGARDGTFIQDWTRASSLNVYQGRMFVTTATCYRRLIEPELPPDDIRGKVFAFSTGAAVSHDHDLGAGWKHVTAVRNGTRMTLYVDGQPVAATTSNRDSIDASTEVPLQIGFGPQSHFHGAMRDVRLYNRALSDDEILAQHTRDRAE
ncbi:MAG: LamG domain-containing protein [Planctomycetaceae bacterium]|nr:LamG domain-containing protein [Planctomycetaceae bacterium]